MPSSPAVQCSYPTSEGRSYPLVWADPHVPVWQKVRSRRPEVVGSKSGVEFGILDSIDKSFKKIDELLLNNPTLTKHKLSEGLMIMRRQQHEIVGEYSLRVKVMLFNLPSTFR